MKDENYTPREKLIIASLIIGVILFMGLLAPPIDEAKIAKEKEYRENTQKAIENYNRNHKDDWNGYGGTRRGSFAEDQKLKSHGYDPEEYRKSNGY